MGEQKFALKPFVEACEEALVMTGGRGDEEDMRVSTPEACSRFAGTSEAGTAPSCLQTRSLPSRIRHQPAQVVDSYSGRPFGCHYNSLS